MTSLLVLALLLAFLLGQATATSPGVDPSLSPSPMGSFYPDPDGMLDAICEICCISINYCAHALAYPHRAPTFTEATFLEHPEWPRDSRPDLDVLSDYEMEEPEPQPPSHHGWQPPLCDDIVRTLDDNETRMQFETIQAHIEGPYNVLDRIAPPLGSRRPTHKRQAPRPGGGYSCTQCPKTFDRSCDLKRHAKTHLDRSERPHKCPVCNEGFLYPKDCQRHERTHEQSSSSQTVLHCSVVGCNNVAGFSRRDNLRRHQRNQHPHLFAT